MWDRGTLWCSEILACEMSHVVLSPHRSPSWRLSSNHKEWPTTGFRLENLALFIQEKSSTYFYLKFRFLYDSKYYIYYFIDRLNIKSFMTNFPSLNISNKRNINATRVLFNKIKYINYKYKNKNLK
jgi:hypothetical protein